MRLIEIPTDWIESTNTIHFSKSIVTHYNQRNICDNKKCVWNQQKPQWSREITKCEFVSKEFSLTIFIFNRLTTNTSGLFIYIHRADRMVRRVKIHIVPKHWRTANHVIDMNPVLHHVLVVLHRNRLAMVSISDDDSFNHSL